jgi:hypothetical protein
MLCSARMGLGGNWVTMMLPQHIRCGLGQEGPR